MVSGQFTKFTMVNSNFRVSGGTGDGGLRWCSWGGAGGGDGDGCVGCVNREWFEGVVSIVCWWWVDDDAIDGVYVASFKGVVIHGLDLVGVWWEKEGSESWWWEFITFFNHVADIFIGFYCYQDIKIFWDELVLEDHSITIEHGSKLLHEFYNLNSKLDVRWIGKNYRSSVDISWSPTCFTNIWVRAIDMINCSYKLQQRKTETLIWSLKCIEFL